jgi:hypothetical protein
MSKKLLKTEIKYLQSEVNRLNEEIEYIQAVEKAFPDVTYSKYSEFISKSIINLINTCDIYPSPYYGLQVALFYKGKVVVKSKQKEIIIFPAGVPDPAYIPMICSNEIYDHPDNIKISDYMKTFKKLHISDEYVQKCRMALVNYITTYSGQYKFDLSTLEPKLQKLIMFA